MRYMKIYAHDVLDNDVPDVVNLSFTTTPARRRLFIKPRRSISLMTGSWTG